jgi:acyl-CoA-dependent ceramide synthase
MRHYLNLRILHSEFNEFKTVGPYEMDWAAEQYKGPLSHYISTALLGSLQALNLFWLAAILRIAYRFLFQNQLADERSDDEDEGEEDEGEREGENRATQPVERVAAPELQLNGETVGAVASGAQLENGSAKARKP